MRLKFIGLALLLVLIGGNGALWRANGQTAAQPRTTPRTQAAGTLGQATAPPGANDQPRTAVRPPQTARAGQGATALQPLGPAAPFVLSQNEEQMLDQMLARWEQQSDKIKTFKCNFTRWEYDPTFGDPRNKHLKSQGEGYLKFKSPDRGEYRVTKLDDYNYNKQTYEVQLENLDRWTCDGKSIFEFDARKKHVIERKLPPEMQGKAISDGPLPFLFGAEAEHLKRRYWMRDVTPTQDVGKRIWLEAQPKFQQDAANFKSATVILNDQDFMPYALKITLPGGVVDRHQPDAAKQEANIAYQFQALKVNDPLSVLDFLAPRTPLGWKHIVEDVPTGGQANPPNASDDAGQANRPSGSIRRN